MSSNVKITFRKKIYNSSTDGDAGVVVFDKSTNKVYVGGTCYSSDVKNATINSETNVLSFTKTDGSTVSVNLSLFEQKSNKVTSLSNYSTDTQYPSAKCIYNYIKDKPKSEVVWQAQSVNSGILATESSLSASETPNWQITGLNLSKYQKVKLYIRSGGTGSLSDNYTASAVIKIDLGGLNLSPLGYYIGSTIVQNPNNDNRILALTAAISEDKTSVILTRTTSLYGTSSISSYNNSGRVLYKIVGYIGGEIGHDFQIKGPGEFTGKNFNLQAKYDGSPVTAQWTVISGGQYATVNQWGRVDIEPDTVAQTITVRATYGEITETITTQVTYDNQLVISCPDTITGTSGSAVALYNNHGCVPIWSITNGGSNATIDEYGAITILQSGEITIQAIYDGYTATKIVTLEYQTGTTQETVINEDGSVIETTTTTEVDPETGATTTETTSTTTNDDGSTSYTTEETVENTDGSSTSQSTTTNSDGTSSESTTTTSAPDQETGAVTSNTSTTNYDEEGNTTGSQTNTTTENTDGSSTSTTTNYNENGDPTDTTNQNTDTDGNSSTQSVEYDENGDPTVTGYTIDTSENSDGSKSFDEDGVNTEFYGFDSVGGFRLRMHFTIDFTDQPANQNENHHNILTMKRASPSPWYGFQLRQTGTNKYIILGTQFEFGSNTNTNINPNWIVQNKVSEYDIEVVYDPTAFSNTFVCRELISNRTMFTSDGTFPDLPELRYLTVCIGCALDENGDQYRYSNINVLDFTLEKLPKPLALPVISCSENHITITCSTQGSNIYYKLNNTGNFTKYTTPIEINADTVVQAYSMIGAQSSETVTQTCYYDDGIEEPVIYCDGEYVEMNCETPGAEIYYRFGTSGEYYLYQNPILLNATTVVQAYSMVDNKISEIVTETCTYVPVLLAEPVITCDENIVTITCATNRAQIYYSLDASSEFELYTEPFEISADTIVEAYSTYNNQTSTTVSETCIYEATHDYSQDYLTFRVLSSGNISWMALGNLTKTIEYSVNNGAWTSITSTANGTMIPVVTGDVVRFRGTNYPYATSKSAYSGFEGGTASYDIEGNIMSLVYGDNFANNSTMPNSSYIFCSIFKKSGVVSAENLILPSLTLRSYCYRAMFSFATNLIKAPALPATTLASGCYWYMFEETSISESPVLAATTLLNECYGHMFTGCANLNLIECLATSGFNKSKCLEGWVTNVSNSGTFVKARTATSWTTGNNGIPVGWNICNDSLLYAPQISFDGETFELSCETADADIYYRLGQNGSYSQYTTPVMIFESTVVEAYSTDGAQNSTVVSRTLTYVQETPFEASNKTLSTWSHNGNTITTPYSVNRIDGHSSSYSKGTFNFETYVNLRTAQPTYLWFQHADQSADIYVDDVKVETHWGGYNAFFSDITNYVHRGTNYIKVALCNTTRNTLAPAAGDFNFNATLGNVKLFTSPVLPDKEYGYDGFHVTSTVSTASATIYVKTKIPVGASVVCRITDGTYTWTDTQASTGLEQTFQTTIQNPHLWNGTIDPHLYTITMEIYIGEDLYHSYSRPYGLRYYSYVINDTTVIPGQSYTGFLLNGSPYYLRGVCMHDDVDGKANALTDADYAQEFAIIQELGCNFIRLAHYPHPKEVYDRCDQLGIIVQTEVPCVNKLQSTMPDEYYDHLTIQYTDMVQQHYNHPCIMFWGLSNETSTDNKDFGKTKVEGYCSLIKSMDTERMVGYVLSHSYNNPSSYYNDPNVDWFGGNIYVGWYINKASNDPTSQLNTRIANTVTRVHKPFAFSEYGAGGTQHCHSDNFQSTTTTGNYARHDIEYQMWLHEGHIAAIRNFPQLLFTAEWQLFDIAVSNRNEGYTVCLDGENTSTDENLRRLNNKGLVERDHTTKKDSFYIYKAEWSSQKFVHICGKDYTKMTGRVIKCYTNDGNSLSLYVNNTFVETVSVTDHIATFTAANYNVGDVIRVVASDVASEATEDTFTF